MIKVGINGFGRIGRTFLRISEEKLDRDVEVVAINTRAESEVLAHLFQYDSCFGTFKGNVEFDENHLIINNKKIVILREENPEDICWGELGIDIVVESTGKFKENHELMGHVRGGAKKVILTAPAKGEDITMVMGVNEDKYDSHKHIIISNASCTTNCIAPVVKVINEAFGIEKGLITTVHSYTNDQQILDKSHKDLRRARAAAESIIPTSTGAARAVAKVLPELDGKLNGYALRVPTPTVSITDIVCELKTDVSTEAVNKALEDAAKTSLKGVLGYESKPLVSVDYKGDSRSAIVDAQSTMVIGGNMVKLAAWYDNEWGYSERVVDMVNYIAKSLN